MTVAVLIAWCTASAFAQSGGGYNIKKSTIDSGGHSNLTGGGYKLGGTVGQHDAGDPEGGGYKLTGGFWSPGATTGTPPNGVIWAPATNPTPWPNVNPLATTRSLRFTVTGPAGPSKPEAIKVTMVNLQDPQPANPALYPPPNWSGYESATCAPRTCVGGANNGLTCVLPAPVPTDCPSPGVCTAAVESNGCARWVGKLGTFREAQDSPASGTYKAARLQCTPLYWDWKPEGLFAVIGADIAPSSEYSVRVYGASCMGAEAGCLAVSPAVTMFTRRSGDVEAPFCPPTCTGTETGGQPNSIDIAQLVNKFKNVPGALVKAISQLQPNLPEANADINALDIVAVVNSIKGPPYAFSGPCACPSVVPCGVTACSSVSPCVTAYGPGSTCVKTCVGGSNPGEPCINDTHDHCPGGVCGPGFCRDRCGRCSP